MQFEKLTCLKGPGKTSSNKITQEDKQEVAPGKKNVRTACPKDKLEFTFFFEVLESSTAPTFSITVLCLSHLPSGLPAYIGGR